MSDKAGVWGWRRKPVLALSHHDVFLSMTVIRSEEEAPERASPTLCTQHEGFHPRTPSGTLYVSLLFVQEDEGESSGPSWATIFRTQAAKV